MESVTYLEPGEFASGRKLDQRFATVLGSCISLILWHPASRFFAMCHYLMVTQGKTQHEKAELGRYGDQILPYFMRLFHQAGLPPTEVQAYAYGGASNPATQGLARHYQVAQSNVDYVTAFMEQADFYVVDMDLGGTTGRKVLFDATTGECKMSLLTVGKSQ